MSAAGRHLWVPPLPMLATRRPAHCEAEKQAAAPAVANTPPPADQSEDSFIDMKEAPWRWTPYLARAKMIFVRNVRYLAYTSDVGESFRPVLSPWLVKATYGISAGYCAVDTGIAGYTANKNGHSQEVVAAVTTRTAVFQLVASLGVPAVIIHTVVHRMEGAVKSPSLAKFPAAAKYGPSGVGLAMIPLLPLVDEPCEHVIDWCFDQVWPCWRQGHSHSH